MTAMENVHGEIQIKNDVLTQLAGLAATNCFGVKGMAIRSRTDGLVHLLKKESVAKGVNVSFQEDGSVCLELHIIVKFGVNLQALSDSIMNEVRYRVNQATGIKVAAVDIYVDSMRGN